LTNVLALGNSAKGRNHWKPMSNREANLQPTQKEWRPDPDLLRSLQVFEELPDQLISRLSAISELVTAPAGTRLCHEGEVAELLHILLDGQLALIAQSLRGRDAVIEVIRPIRHVVLGTVLAGLPYAVSADLIASSTLLGIAVEGLQELLPNSPQLAAALFRAQAADFSAMVRQVCDLKLHTAGQRLGAYLLELAAEQLSGRRELRLPIDKQLLAAHLGCRKENLSRAFASLRSYGVETHGRRVILNDIQVLRAFIFRGNVSLPSSA
jgi:CRP/FNR family transcriptional activator FtrB